MTPQEKADELHVGYWRLTNDSRVARQCALLAVDEILNIKIVRRDDWADDYWFQVKQEIEKL